MKRFIYLLTITIFSLNITIGQEIEEIRTNNKVGTLAGSVSINPDGSVSYDIPLGSLPGRVGMEPGVSLVYNSMNGDGPLGLGWSVSGLQTISRGGTNLYFEDAIDGVDFDDNDTYYYNGQRLIEVATNEYRTEQEEFSQIIANGTAGSGPQSFTVLGKNGIELQFGQTTDSRIEASGRVDVLFWRLNRVEDKSGNYIDYFYDETNHEGLISRIEYTGNTKTNESTFNSIDFIYKNRNNNSTFYIYGSSIEQSQLLDKIETKYNNQIVNTYELTYDETWLAPKLTSVQPKYKSGKQMNATNFEWGGQSTNIDISYLQNLQQEDDYLMGDFNGDGKSDIIWYERKIDNTLDWQVFYADVDGESFIPGYNHTEDNKFLYFQVGDINGDGLDDITLIRTNICTVMYSQGQTFSGPLFVLDTRHPENTDHRFYNIDINGNGKSEIVMIEYNIPSGDPNNPYLKNNILVLEHQENGSFVSILEDPSGDGFSIFTLNELLPINLTDFTGDGKTDFLLTQDDQSGYTTLFEFEDPLLVSSSIFNESFLLKESKLFGDFNGDGISDCFIINNSSVDVHLFDGKDTWIIGPTISAPPQPGELYYEYDGWEFMIGDFNGDNLFDIVLTFKEWYNPLHGERELMGTHITTYYSNGAGVELETEFFPNRDYTFYAEGTSSYYDFNGDGKMDALIDYSEEVRRIMSFHKKEKSNMIHKFTNGLGYETSVEYDYLTNDKIYEKGNNSVYPIMDIQSPMVVAVKSLSQNGLGGFIESNFTYKKAKVHINGKGMLGFGEFIVLNNTANTISETKFEILEQDANGNPKYFLPYIAETYLYSTSTNGIDPDTKDKLLNKTINTMDVISTTPNGFGYLPVITQTINSQWDNDGGNSHISTSEVIQDKSNIDQYGNSTFSKTKVFATTNINLNPIMTTETIMSYVYDEANWILDRPIRVTSIIKTPDNADYLTTTNYDYYSRGEPGGNGIYPWPKVKSVETIPENDNNFKNTISFEYDNYGNVTKETLKAFDLTGEEPYQTIEKVTENIYASTNGYLSRFLTKSTVKEGPDYETNYTYEAERGLPVAVTNPSGLVTQFYHDDFGRLEFTRYPDNNYKASLLSWVTENTTDEPPGALYYNFIEEGGSSETKVFYDKLGRQMRVVGEGMTASQKILVDTYYNDRGLTDKVSEPFFAENPPDEGDETKWTSVLYDRIGRPYFTKTPTNSFTTTYSGLTTSVKDNYTGITKTNQKNSLGQTVIVNDPSGDIKYTYYSSGLLHTTDALGQVTTLIYNPLGNKVSMKEPNMGIYSYKYGAFGELLEQRDNKGNTTTMNYDGIGRVVNKKVNNDITQYVYNEESNANGFGMLQQIIGHNSINYTYEYDAFDRLYNETKTIDGTDYETLLEYDVYSRIKTYTYPSMYKINYLYTSETGMLYKITDEDDNMLYETDEINQRGQLLNYSLGNGLETNKVYDIFGFPKSIITSNVQDLEYNFNTATGNLNWRKQKSVGNDLWEKFEYDNGLLHNRLTSWQVNMQQAYSINYEPNGNISTKTDVTTDFILSSKYKYGDKGAPNAVQQIFTPAPDYLEEASQTQEIEYTAFNKVESINQLVLSEGRRTYYNTLDFTYGPDNTRKKTVLYKNDNAIKTKYFISSSYEIEIDEFGIERKLHYISGADGLFAIYEWKGVDKKMYYIHKDYLGSYETVTNELGNLVEKISYDPWGRKRNPINWTFDDFPWVYKFDRGYTGHEVLEVFGLINMNGRVYDPRIGRMLSPDPILQSPGNSQNYNRYSYAMNNPLKYTDPSGYNFEGYDSGHGNPLGGGSGGSYNYDGGLNPGSGGQTGMTFNPYRAEIMRSTAHSLNKAAGFKYGKVTHRGTRGYINTWTGEQVSWDFVKKNLVDPYATVDDKFKAYFIARLNYQRKAQATQFANNYRNYWNNKYSYGSTPAKTNFLASTGGGDDQAGGVDEFSYWDGFLLAWNLKVIFPDFPDLISLDITISSNLYEGVSETFALNLMTRGESGLFVTKTYQSRKGAEIDWGINLNIAYFQGNPLNISRASVEGPVKSVSAGFMYGGQAFLGYGARGNVAWLGFGLGVGLTYGGSYGEGKTIILWPNN